MKMLAMRMACLVAAMLFAGSGLATPIVFFADLDGPAESPPNASPGTGSAEVAFDLAAHTLDVHVVFADLLGTTTASHIHCCVATPGTGTASVATAVPTFPGFPLGVTSGTYDQTFDTSLLSTYNPAFVTAHGGTAAGAEADLFAAMLQGRTYLNVHTNLFPGGEIRGFLQAPEPGSVALIALALGGCAAVRRRARHR